MDWSFWVIGFIKQYNQFVLGYLATINGIYTIILLLSFRELYLHLKRVQYGDYFKMITSSFIPPISILVPSYNEEKTIVENVKSLIALEYGEFEVVVINDGSKDHTLQHLIDSFQLQKVDMPFKKSIETKNIRGIYLSKTIQRLVVVDKENGGKADALNAGINICRYPLFTAIDADSILEKDSLVRVVRPFVEDPDRVVATGGIIRIVNGSKVDRGFIEEIGLSKNGLAMLQTVEYLRAFLTGRAGWNALNGLLIISGAFGVFKKNIVATVGGYTSDTIGEDMELVMKIHRYMYEQKQKYRVVFIPDPVCWTQAPENFKSLSNQRKRWHRGLMDSLISHWKMLFNPQYGRIGMLVIPYYWIFEMIGPFIEMTGYITVGLSFLFGILNLEFAILFFIMAVLYGIFISISSILLEEYTFRRYEKVSEYMRLIFYSIFENFGYRQLTTWWRVRSVFGYRVKKNKWGNIDRQEFREEENKIS
ncbi:glycosyltransferase [Clostridiaceae bacterium 35-E11]